MVILKLKSGSHIRILIAELGHSLRSFSDMIGVSHAYLSQVLNGKKNPSPIVGHKIAKGVYREIEDIFLIETVENNNQNKQKEVK